MVFKFDGVKISRNLGFFSVLIVKSMVFRSKNGVIQVFWCPIYSKCGVLGVLNMKSYVFQVKMSPKLALLIGSLELFSKLAPFEKPQRPFNQWPMATNFLSAMLPRCDPDQNETLSPTGSH